MRLKVCASARASGKCHILSLPLAPLPLPPRLSRINPPPPPPPLPHPLFPSSTHSPFRLQPNKIDQSPAYFRLTMAVVLFIYTVFTTVQSYDWLLSPLPGCRLPSDPIIQPYIPDVQWRIEYAIVAVLIGELNDL